MVVDYLFPRNPEIVRQQIEGTKKLVREALKLLKKFPSDAGLKFSLEQYAFLLRQLALEWKLARAFQEAIDSAENVFARGKSITYYISTKFNLPEAANLLENIDDCFENKKSLDCYTAGSVTCQEDFVLGAITCIKEEKEFCRFQVEVRENSVSIYPASKCTVNCISEFLDRFFSRTVGWEKIEKIKVDNFVLWKKEGRE